MRRVSRFTVAFIGLLLFSMTGVAAVNAASSEESGFVSEINRERSRRGTHTLRWREDIANVARRHSRRMADQNHLHHNGNLRNEVSGWEVLGENVGYGPSVDELHAAFMNSTAHRANILDREYTHVGVGTVWDGNTLWVTQVFMRPSGSSSSGSTASSPRSSSKPARRTPPASRPAPRKPQPATPPRKPVTAPPPAPPAAPPAPPSGSAHDLTRMMVANLLASDHPAVGVVGASALAQSPVLDNEAELTSVAFRPFAIMASRVNRALLTGSK